MNLNELNPVREAREILHFIICNPTVLAFSIVERFNDTFKIALPVDEWWSNLIAIACDAEVQS